MSKKLVLVLLLFLPFLTIAQDPYSVNTDSLLSMAQQDYRNGQFQKSLDLTRRGLSIAPDYHDIRILQIRNLWALGNFPAADKDLFLLLDTSPTYPDLKPLALSRINSFSSNSDALLYIQKLETFYPADLSLQIAKADLLLKKGDKRKARDLADSLYSENLKDGERYLLRQILNQTLRNEIGISYQYINFSGDYSRNKEWNSFSAELQHHFGRTAVLGRTTFSNRGYDEGTLYELEAYPILNDRFYSFVNLGFSNGKIFPEKKASASVFYNFAKVLEAEVGGRILIYDKSSYFSGIIGLTAYTGKFYFNIRSFLGPERSEQLIRNHQFNLRYYISSVDDYLFLRLGTGISPDETALFSRIQQNPTLDASYANIGLQKSISVHHHFQVAAGILHEEITASKTGNQFIGNISYRYRF